MTRLAAFPLGQSDLDAPIRGYDDLLQPFYAAEKPRELWRIGAETERFGVLADSGRPLGYDGQCSVVQVLRVLQSRYGYQPLAEREGGPIIGLVRGASKITLEPGGQLELSGAPLGDVHAVIAEIRLHLTELARVGGKLGVTWLATGFHPLARLDELPHVPKQRYPIMREYFSTRGSGGLDMMWRTATVQANFDYSSEQDALRKLRVALRLSPLVNAMTANSAFCEGRQVNLKSLRGDVWLRVDAERTGLIPGVWRPHTAGYRDYVDWALDAGMFFFMRGARAIINSGQSFRSFFINGYQGYAPTLRDWQHHLNTLFPEVRLKQTLEIRCADALPCPMAAALPALFTGVLYDEQALEEAEQLMAPVSYEQMVLARPRLVREGLGAMIGTTVAARLAERLIEIAAGGLERRCRPNALGQDERVFLEPLAQLTVRGLSPSDLVAAPLPDDAAQARAELIVRTRA
jgi:glutamate--cysteine ligase